jgi:chemotaxis protein MotA
MDLATLIGLLVGWSALLGSVIMEGGELSGLINPSAFVLVAGGTLGATMIGYPMSSIVGMVGVVRNAFFTKAETPGEVIKMLVDFTRKARRDGILALEDEARKLDNRLFKTGIQLIVDGTPEEVVRNILETEIIAMQARHHEGAAILAAMAGFAPTMGVIGTVMGLVHMLSNLSDPGKMGPMIAAAFIATLYGVSFANLIYLPLSNKLKNRSTEEVAMYEMLIEGIMALQAGENPRIVEAKMIAFCPPKSRDSISEGSEA